MSGEQPVVTSVTQALELGMKHYQAGRFQQAEQLYRQILQTDPQHFDALYLLGAIAHRVGRNDQAIAYFTQALRRAPHFAEGHCNLGVVLKAQGRLDEAAACYQQALRLQPQYPAAHNNLGNVLKQQGRLAEAVACYRQAVHQQADYPEAHNNLGMALQEQGKLADAVLSYRQALQFRPDYAEAYNNLGMAFQEQGKLAEAEASYRQAVRLQPDHAEPHNNLGVVLKDRGKPVEAIASWQRALRLKPDFVAAHGNLSDQLAEEGQFQEAEAHLQEALRLRPTAQLRIQLATLLPRIYQSCQEVLAWRQRLTEHVGALHQDQVTLDLTNQAAAPPFFLVYQGGNDRDLQRAIARLYSAPQESRGSAALGCHKRSGKIRIGFLSRYLKTHTIGRLMRGLIAHLDRDPFAVTVLALGNSTDPLARWIREHADEYVEVPSSLPAARRLIAEQQLDVLLYTDIGMDPLSYTLAFSRLAPVQCVTWGHPVTTGIPTVDYFLSSQALETAAGDQHYTEQLVRLPHLPIYYYRPLPPTPLKARGYFGLPTEGTLYACPQTLFKFHPEFDLVLGGILRRDPRGQLALIRGKYAHWDRQLQQRFAVTLPDVQERIHWLPPQGYDEFLNLNAVADVLLDPLHFGGGNTSYEGLALGVPIVTLPTEFLRARITAALYQQLGVLDCVVSSPAEYVERAVRLGTDADYRRAVRGKIESASEVLFENRAGVRDLEQFLHAAVERARSRDS